MRRTVTLLLACGFVVACGAHAPSQPSHSVATAGVVTAGRGGATVWRGGRGGPLAREPELGVACPHANSLACDRVGLGVWLKAPAAGVSATIAGTPLRLHAGGLGGRGPKYWEGYLTPAGLLSGALKVTPDRGRYFWRGTRPKLARLVLTIHRALHRPVEVAQTVELRPGWG